MLERVRAGLLNGGWRELAFEHFRAGIAVHWIVRGGHDAPSLALLKYEAGASVPRHRHAGLETILVLEGVQCDENGNYPQGTLVFNAVDTEHSVWTDEGCVVLIHWTLPVVILQEGQ